MARTIDCAQYISKEIKKRCTKDLNARYTFAHKKFNVIVTLFTCTTVLYHMWLLLMYYHLHENREYEFGCVPAALAQWPTF